MTFSGSPNEAFRIANDSDVFRAIEQAVNAGMRVAMPGVIANFDPNTQTCTVDISVYEKVNLNGVVQDMKIPTLLDVPLLIPRGGGFALTFPVKTGDECLVIFGDICINSWWANGGINNTQERPRRHDFSDGFAILAPTSQPKKLNTYSTSSSELRTENGTVSVSIDNSSVTLKGANLDLDGTLNLIGSAAVPSISSADHSLLVNINGVPYYLKLSTTP